MAEGRDAPTIGPETSVVRALVAAVKRCYGKGAVSARGHFIEDDIFVVVMREPATTAERSMAEAGQGARGRVSSVLRFRTPMRRASGDRRGPHRSQGRHVPQPDRLRSGSGLRDLRLREGRSDRAAPRSDPARSAALTRTPKASRSSSGSTNSRGCPGPGNQIEPPQAVCPWIGVVIDMAGRLSSPHAGT